jgi:hypothetical protein
MMLAGQEKNRAFRRGKFEGVLGDHLLFDDKM